MYTLFYFVLQREIAIMADKCAFCNYNTKKSQKAYRGRRLLSGNAYDWHRNYLANACQIDGISEESVLCKKCRTKLDKIKIEDASLTSPAVDNEMRSDDDGDADENCPVPEPQPNVSVNVQRVGKTHAKCVVCTM